MNQEIRKSGKKKPAEKKHTERATRSGKNEFHPLGLIDHAGGGKGARRRESKIVKHEATKEQRAQEKHNREMKATPAANQKSEVGSRKSEVRRQKAEVKRQRTHGEGAFAPTPTAETGATVWKPIGRVRQDA